MPWVISGNGLPVPDLKYLSTAEEAEMRIWRHATLTSAQHILLTETYNIGLPIVQQWYSSIQCILQLNVPLSPVLKYLRINNLIQALEDDQDLVTQRQTTHHYSDALYLCFLFQWLGQGCFSYNLLSTCTLRNWNPVTRYTGRKYKRGLSFILAFWNCTLTLHTTGTFMCPINTYSPRDGHIYVPRYWIQYCSSR